FEEAGADGIFIPFIKEIETVAELKKTINLPLNILINDLLNISELRKLKVNRVSVGGKPMLAVLNTLRVIAKELKNGNDWHSLFVKEPNYGEVNSWFI
ncbi:MAG: isocitrate lyase/phosphoenolpyruvate mutase family protein, partial [Ignavibacteriaceae bacterium]|nr:isocitrate lyase/phosphoenolpyruvate mutase family protein [Ignavibacteriaceae bacterium]